MDLSDRVKALFGLQDEPHCNISVNVVSGDLDIDCLLGSICVSILRNHLEQVVRGGVAFNVPHINIRHDHELIYRFPVIAVMERIWQEGRERRV